MRITIFARIIATPIQFPEKIEMRYVCLDEQGRFTGKEYAQVYFPWDEVCRRFMVPEDYAKECESYFKNGESAFLGNREIEIVIADNPLTQD